MRRAVNRPSGSGTRPAALAAACILWSYGPAGALECPVPHPRTTAQALKEPEAAIERYSDLLSRQGERAVPRILGRLSRHHPRASNAEFTNYLITLYCPVVQADASLTPSQKRERLQRFSSSLMRNLAGQRGRSGGV